MEIGSLLKFSIGLIGLSVALLILVLGFVKKDNAKIKRAAVVFIGTWVVLLMIGLLEFFLAV
ncbi:MAG: hypothetical protein JSS79_03900 [Bacteroidetes bacterium]|nr:hypothetical protein [Bacteroidota bacterium]